MTHKITRFLTLFLLVSLGGCTVQSEHHVPENAAFCDDLTKHVQQVQQLHVASGTIPIPPSRNCGRHWRNSMADCRRKSSAVMAVLM